MCVYRYIHTRMRTRTHSKQYTLSILNKLDTHSITHTHTLSLSLSLALLASLHPLPPHAPSHYYHSLSLIHLQQQAQLAQKSLHEPAHQRLQKPLQRILKSQDAIDR